MSLGLTSRRRDAQQLCLIFQTTAATRRRDRKQLCADGQKKKKRWVNMRNRLMTEERKRQEQAWEHLSSYIYQRAVIFCVWVWQAVSEDSSPHRWPHALFWYKSHFVPFTPYIYSNKDKVQQWLRLQNLNVSAVTVYKITEDDVSGSQDTSCMCQTEEAAVEPRGSARF